MKNSSTLNLSLSILLFISFSSPLFAKKTKRHHDDKKALLEIKAAWGNPYDLSSWDPKTDCCEWYVLQCDDRPPYRVNELSLDRSSIFGPIPAAIGDLPYLKLIFFRHVPNLTGTIPPSITKLSNLDTLILSFTGLSGPIPTYLTKLKKLEELDLSFNSFTGSIPSQLSQLKNLEYLHLDRNKLTGTIPESFGDFTSSLTNLALSHNHLTGTVPESLTKLKLETLDLSRNNLTGDASFLLSKSKTIQVLDLSRNNFTFDLSKVEFPESLRSLDLNHNKIFGSLSQQLNKLEFQSFNVSYNRLCGKIPQGGSLQRFDLYSFFHNKCLCGAPLPACK